MRLLLLALVPYAVWSSPTTIQGTQDSWPPYFIEGPDTGQAHKVLEDIFMRSGFKLDIKFQPWNRALKSVQTQEMDMVLGAWKTTQRERFLYFSEPYYWNEIIVLSRIEKPFEYFNHQSLKGMKIGVQRGYRYSEDFEQLDYFEKYEVSSAEESIHKLMKKRFDAALIDKSVLYYTLEKIQVSPDLFHASKIPFSCIPLHVATSKENQSVTHYIDRINITLLKEPIDNPCLEQK